VGARGAHQGVPRGGDFSLGEEFLRSVVPFVYRKYLDFTAIEEIKGMKDRINLAASRSFGLTGT